MRAVKIGRLAGARGQLASCSAMHVVNDGLFAGTYPLLPLMAAELGLSYAQVGAIKTAYSGASSVLQVPAGIAAERVGEQALLALGTGWVGLGLLLVALTGSYLPLLVASAAAGLGGNVQHPVASAVVSRLYDAGRRATAIGTLNFAGDVGKVLAPLVVGVAAAAAGWRAGFVALGVIGAVFGVGYALLVPEPAKSVPGTPGVGREDRDAHPEEARRSDTTESEERTGTEAVSPASGWGIRAPGTFAALIGIGMLDASARGTALVFIPFLLAEKGAEAASMSFYFAVLFAAGAAGKFICGPLGDRFGSTAVIAITELVTAAALIGLVGAPLELALLALLPLGFMLNGTSSVLYASVASLVHASRRARGYGLYYTCSLVSSAASPLVYGLVADRLGLPTAIVALAVSTAAIVPVVLVVGSRLSDG